MGKSWIGSSGVGAGPGYMSMGMGMGMAGRKPPTLFAPHIDALGFDSLGLGDPAYMWLAKDQSPNLARMVTRIGMPWEFVRQDGGTLVYNASGWGGLPTVEIQNGGVNVRCGFRCNAFAPGAMVKPPPSLPASYNRVFTCAFIAPSVLATGQVIWPFSWSDGSLDTRWGNYLFQGNPTGHGAYMSMGGNLIFNKGNISPQASWVGKRITWVGTWRYSENSLTFHTYGGFRVQGVPNPIEGFWRSEGRTSESIPNGTYNFTTFSHGFEDTPTFGDAATGMSYAGSVGWVGQLPLDNTEANFVNQALDLWDTIYPLN